MAEKRDKLTIIHDILKSIADRKGKIKPTHLLYKSNLSYQRMQSYLDDLKQKQLVNEEQEKSGKMYVLTEKGYQFLAEYGRIKEFTESFGL
jgi:predicted transcriptional regulator